AWLTGGAILSFTFIMIAVFSPHWINRFWGMDFFVPATDPNQQFLVSRDNRVKGDSLKEDQWIDARNGAIRQGDLHIQVESVKASPAPPKNETNQNTMGRLLVTMRISNAGQLHHYVYQAPSLTSDKPTLHDDKGKKYALRDTPRREAPKAMTKLKPLAQ